jgi:hypothetical protein
MLAGCCVSSLSEPCGPAEEAYSCGAGVLARTSLRDAVPFGSSTDSTHPLRYRIANFYLPEQRLIIEIDGPYHDPVADRLRIVCFWRHAGFGRYG